MRDSWIQNEDAKSNSCVLEFGLAFQTYKGLKVLGSLLHGEPPHKNGEVICHRTTAYCQQYCKSCKLSLIALLAPEKRI